MNDTKASNLRIAFKINEEVDKEEPLSKNLMNIVLKIHIYLQMLMIGIQLFFMSQIKEDLCIKKDLKSLEIQIGIRLK